MSHIVIVEDERQLAELERDYLKAAGYEVTLFDRGDTAQQWLETHEPDLLVLDLMLPGLDGLELCRNLRRRSTVPIIMTTARVEEVDRLIGLEIGADDYLCKPFSLRELVARVKVILRRTHPEAAPPVSLNPILNEALAMVELGSHSVELTQVEVRLLALLQNHPRRIFSRDQIIDHIYEDRRIVSDRTVDSHIKKLRRKLQQLSEDHDFIHSVYGAGYRYHPRA
ncbi:response regulator [Reinekea blandensis]|uniref:Possible baeR Response regulators consisting of a CheY-like receiver domain and a HTH DNA-binding domain n=1 Tax=Reinekea blandensis MED297 TaxID=314283 RepID=A4BII1_9GAMM|nr:response regulator [Reinekea blandensis]EAR08060.1 possible baeR; Response regulators consisting of a CheY-like receiver domain and a HTH DNA-binding domain [Reinekea sp. MED297] [Reinekea blandensis MED297]